MRTPVFLSRLPTARQASTGLRLALVLVLAVVGVLLLRDRPGLRAEYFALGEPWEGRPFNTDVGEPRLEDASRVGEALRTKVMFSIRWRGWWAVREAGEHGFSLDADDGGYLRIDDRLVVDTQGVFGERRETGRIALEPGFHEVEIGLYQSWGESRLAVDWTGPGSTAGSAATLPAADLFAGRPLLLRRALRSALPGWPRTYRQLLGVVLLLAAVLLSRGFAARLERPVARVRARLEALDGRRLRAGMLLAVFAAAFFASLPYTGTVLGGDDTSYLYAATFNAKRWFFNRYGHVYLLKLFTVLGGGDPLVGVRLWWSFSFAATVAALAVAVKSVGPGLQLRTLTVTLFVLFAQAPLFGLIGAGFADFSAMMFVTVAVAVYMHGLASARVRPPPRHEWHALAIGALTVGAFRSKEVGAVLLLLPVLFLIGNGGIDLRRFARQTAYWLVGALGALLTLMTLDAWLLGDFLFTLDSDRLAHSRKMNFPAGQALRKATQSWFHTVWTPLRHEANLSLRNLWLGVCAAALVAGLRRRRLEIRVLHLLPIAYLLALIALYVRMPHPLSARMLITILPVASLMTGLLLHHAGLEEVPWRRILKPVVLIPAVLAAAVLLLVVVPYRLGRLEIADLLPQDLLLRHGWTPDHFTIGVLLPAVALILAALAALFASRRRAWLAALVVAYLAFFGVGFEINRTSLAKRWAAQTGDLLVYPWRTFRAELDAVPNATVALSKDLESFFNMSATTRSALGRVALRQPDLYVIAVDHPPARADMAIASRYAWESWRQRTPALAATASFDPAGFLVLVRPKQAAGQPTGQPGQQPADGLAAAPAGSTLEQRLDELRLQRDPAARSGLLKWIHDRLEGPDHRGRSFSLQTLLGERLRAVALSPDGWTDGTKPAGLIARNPDQTPWVQELRLTVHAAASEYPIRVFVDDGEQTETVRFDRGGSRRIKLRPVPPRSSRLILIWTDKAWSPKNKTDDRLLGVRIRALAPP